jgi:hypothetical protein
MHGPLRTRRSTHEYARKPLPSAPRSARVVGVSVRAATASGSSRRPQRHPLDRLTLAAPRRAQEPTQNKQTNKQTNEPPPGRRWPDGHAGEPIRIVRAAAGGRLPRGGGAAARCCPLHVACCPLHVRCMLSVACCMLSVACPLHVVRCMLRGGTPRQRGASRRRRRRSASRRSPTGSATRPRWVSTPQYLRDPAVLRSTCGTPEYLRYTLSGNLP